MDNHHSENFTLYIHTIFSKLIIIIIIVIIIIRKSMDSLAFGSGAHPGSYTMGTVSFPRVKRPEPGS
jgi:hypothetical protein